jgi:quinol monooxygenase YgiN
MSTAIRIVARVIALPDKIETVKAVLIELLEPTRKEAGCIKYELLQNQSDPTDFTFVEEWTDNGAIDTHLLSLHIQEAIAKLDGFITNEPDIRRYQEVED